ncbi:MlaA lipoprotein [Collimonas sp. OK607]|nr:MlaA lipoprotein [Collimonas sp. OK607]
MKTIQSVVLAAIVLGTNARASNAARHQPAATLTCAQSRSGTPVASPSDVAQPPMSVAPLPQQESDASAPTSIARSNAMDGAVVDSNVSLADTSVQGPASSGNMSGLATQAEQGVEVLYSRPPVPDPWEGFNRKMHSFNNVLDRFVFRPVAVVYDKVVPNPIPCLLMRTPPASGVPSKTVRWSINLARPA